MIRKFYYSEDLETIFGVLQDHIPNNLHYIKVKNIKNDIIDETKISYHNIFGVDITENINKIKLDKKIYDEYTLSDAIHNYFIGLSTLNKKYSYKFNYSNLSSNKEYKFRC